MGSINERSARSAATRPIVTAAIVSPIIILRTGGLGGLPACRTRAASSRRRLPDVGVGALPACRARCCAPPRAAKTVADREARKDARSAAEARIVSRGYDPRKLHAFSKANPHRLSAEQKGASDSGGAPSWAPAAERSLSNAQATRLIAFWRNRAVSRRKVATDERRALGLSGDPGGEPDITAEELDKVRA